MIGRTVLSLQKNNSLDSPQGDIHFPFNFTPSLETIATHTSQTGLPSAIGLVGPIGKTNL